jgi:hypothetical protein
MTGSYLSAEIRIRTAAKLPWSKAGMSSHKRTTLVGKIYNKLKNFRRKGQGKGEVGAQVETTSERSIYKG